VEYNTLQKPLFWSNELVPTNASYSDRWTYVETIVVAARIFPVYGHGKVESPLVTGYSGVDCFVSLLATSIS
jgi:hypothetical protein